MNGDDFSDVTGGASTIGTPTVVQLGDGSLYGIPTGIPGTWPWAREASLISVAYANAGQSTLALKWKNEFLKRANAYDAIQAGADAQATINAGSWIDGPASIVSYFANTAKRLIDDALNLADTLGKGPGKVLDWVPWLIMGGLVVLAIAFNRRSLRIRL